jgi:hypothetical protein
MTLLAAAVSLSARYASRTSSVANRRWKLDHGLGETRATGATLRTPDLALTGDNRIGLLFWPLSWPFRVGARSRGRPYLYENACFTDCSAVNAASSS